MLIKEEKTGKPGRNSSFGGGLDEGRKKREAAEYTVMAHRDDPDSQMVNPDFTQSKFERIQKKEVALGRDPTNFSS